MTEFVTDYLAYLLAKCSHVVSASFHAKLKKQGVPVITWRILCSINQHPRTIGELVDMVLVSQPTLSKALDRLERDGLVVRKRDQEYRRQVFVHITDKAQKILDELLPMAAEDELNSFAHMSDQDKKQLKKLLQALISVTENS